MKWYVGLSNTGHDPAISIVDPDGNVVFAEATERFLQVKRAWGVPPDLAAHLKHAFNQTSFEPSRDQVEVCTSWASTQRASGRALLHPLMGRNQLDAIADYQADLFDNLGASFRLLDLANGPVELRRFEHHSCHTATAVHFSKAGDAICLVIDGEGETGAASQYTVAGRRIKRDWRSWNAGASLGFFYRWLTVKCGFSDVLGEEWKVMGLAACGQVREDLVEALSRTLTFNNHRPVLSDDDVINEIDVQIQHAVRGVDEPVMQAADLAASGQYVYSRFADELVRGSMEKEPEALLLTGGCALNSSYNGTIQTRFGLPSVEIPPCPADDGNAIGAALLAWSVDHDAPIPPSDGSPYLGSAPDQHMIARFVRHAADHFDVAELGSGSAGAVAQRLSEGDIIGVMRGRAEFGPRALGHRSILADPRRADMKDRINNLVKGREPYRPFAPVVPAHLVGEWFEDANESPYMSKTLKWRHDRQALVPSVVHADGTGRVQTVCAQQNAWLFDLVMAFAGQTGVPVILNTSLNIMGKPIVHSVEDTIAVLMTTGLDAVLLEDYLIEKRS